MNVHTIPKSNKPLTIGFDFDDMIANSDQVFSLGAQMILGRPIPQRKGAHYLLGEGFTQEQIFGLYHAILSNKEFTSLLEPNPGAIQHLRTLHQEGHALCCPTARPYEQAFMIGDFFKRYGLHVPVRSTNGSFNKTRVVGDLDVHLDDNVNVLHTLREEQVRTATVHYTPHDASSWDLQATHFEEFYEHVREQQIRR